MEEQIEAVQDQPEVLVENTVSEPTEELVQVNGGFSLGVSAKQDVMVESSLVVGAAAGRDMTTSNGLNLSSAVGRDLTVTDGMAGVSVVGQGLNINDGAAVVAISQSATVQNGAIGLLVAGDAHIAEGSKVMVNMSTKQAVAFGVAFAAALAVLTRLFRRK